LARIESEVFYESSFESIIIPSNVEILGSKCFSECNSFSSITFESNSRLTQIESSAFSNSSLQSILIPNSVEILGSKCFSFCKSLSSISFESNSRLTRIESEAFSYSSLQSIVIPSSLQFIDGSAFIHLNLSSISIESGNEYFVLENDFLINVIHHTLICNFSKSSDIEIGSEIEILGSSCFSECKSLSSISFESNSRLTRIERFAFSNSSLQSIVIPSKIQFIDGSAFIDVNLSFISIESGNEYFAVENNLLIDIIHHTLIRNFSESSDIEIGSDIEILGSSCFSDCHSLSSISFESNSRLIRIESYAFSLHHLNQL
jgi:predicted metal-binding protein